MIWSEFSYNKLKRKLHNDGIRNAFIAAGDLVTRKQFGRPVFDLLVDEEFIRTTPRDELQTRAHQTVSVSTALNEDVQPFVTLVKKGMIFSETGLVWTEDLGIIAESAAEPKQARQAMMAMISRELFYGDAPMHRLLARYRPPHNPSVTLNTVAPLIPRYPNYYHWMVETVPKIRYLRAFEEATGRSVTVLVPDDAPQFVEETLRLIGWPQSKTMQATESAYTVQNLVIPSYPERHASDFEWMQTEILEAVPSCSESSSGKNVYVSRSNAIERRVLNENEVMNILNEYGFNRYCLENQSVADNVQLFSQADIIIGPHGAGLTDIIFADDCTLIELFGSKIKEPYELLADTLGVEYIPMYCQAASADIVVNTERLHRRITKVCGPTNGSKTS